MEKMIKYCKKDVTLLEQVFKALRGHMIPKTHYGVIFGEDRGSCPECGAGGKDLILNNKVIKIEKDARRHLIDVEDVVRITDYLISNNCYNKSISIGSKSWR